MASDAVDVIWRTVNVVVKDDLVATDITEEVVNALIAAGFEILGPGELEQRGWVCQCPDASFLPLDNGPHGEITVPVYVRTTAPEHGGQG